MFKIAGLPGWEATLPSLPTLTLRPVNGTIVHQGNFRAAVTGGDFL